MKERIGMKHGEPVTGVVVFCEKLNVREQPNIKASILDIIAAGTEVMIDESESTSEFYKVCCDSGIEGFCMKKFIAITHKEVSDGEHNDIDKETSRNSGRV